MTLSHLHIQLSTGVALPGLCDEWRYVEPLATDWHETHVAPSLGG